MLVSRFLQFQGANGPDSLEVRCAPVQEPGFGEIRIRVEAMSLNRSDLMFVSGEYLEKPQLPSRFGSEVAGIVEAVGERVEGIFLGDRITSINAFAIGQYGLFGETVVLPARAAIHVPARFTPGQACSFAFAYMTNYFALFEIGQIKPFQVLLITAATSTTGLAGIPMAHSVGATVIATTRTRAKRQALIDAGADHVIVLEEEDLVARTMEITENRGVDVAYDPAPGSLSEKVARSIKRRGHWIVYGVLDAPATFPWSTVFERSLKFNMYKVSEFAGNPAFHLDGQEEVFIEAKRIVSVAVKSGVWPTVPISKEFKGLGSVPEALHYMRQNKATGKIVITL